MNPKASQSLGRGVVVLQTRIRRVDTGIIRVQRPIAASNLAQCLITLFYLLAESIVEASMMSTETPRSFRLPIIGIEVAHIQPKSRATADGSSRANAQVAIIARSTG